jgi:hypothetical protein
MSTPLSIVTANTTLLHCERIEAPLLFSRPTTHTVRRTHNYLTYLLSSVGKIPMCGLLPKRRTNPQGIIIVAIFDTVDIERIWCGGTNTLDHKSIYYFVISLVVADDLHTNTSA